MQKIYLNHTTNATGVLLAHDGRIFGNNEKRKYLGNKNGY
jgi:hypothetical protein